MLPALEGTSPLPVLRCDESSPREVESLTQGHTGRYSLPLCFKQWGASYVKQRSLDFISQLREDFESGNSAVSSGKDGLEGECPGLKGGVRAAGGHQLWEAFEQKSNVSRARPHESSFGGWIVKRRETERPCGTG